VFSIPVTNTLDTSDALVQYIKLEVVWILTNLLFGDTPAIDMILGRVPLQLGINDGFTVVKLNFVRQLNSLLFNEMAHLTSQDP